VITDIRQAYCPMGCGETLHLMPSGLIHCLAPGCPRPDAAATILGDKETEHILRLEDNSWNAVHPLRERINGALLGCDIGEAAEWAHEEDMKGLFRVTRQADGWYFSNLEVFNEPSPQAAEDTAQPSAAPETVTQPPQEG
jgi:Family of unknown function (DUF6085)